MIPSTLQEWFLISIPYGLRVVYLYPIIILNVIIVFANGRVDLNVSINQFKKNKILR